MGVGSIVGAISGPIASHFAQKRAFKYAKNILKNRHQWEVADLRAAGLNPILGYVGSKGGGGGVISPGTSTGGAGQPGDPVAAYRQIKKTKPEIIVAEEAAKQAKNVTERSFHEAFTAGSNSARAATEALTSDVFLQLQRSLIPAATARQELDETKFGGKLQKLKRMLNAIGVSKFNPNTALRGRR